MGSARLQSSATSLPEHRLDNLPLELTSFVGRDRDVAEIKRLLAERRLLTLCGPGGAGKTRLALAVAQDLVEEFEDGVWWVELAPLSDPNLVVRAVASALGVPEPPEISMTEALVEHLKNQKTLLILDNCEHLIEACADLADTLLRACPNLRILATSREPLRVAGEASWQVPSLSLPDIGRLPAAGELAGYEAINLFVERAQAVDAGFTLTEDNAPAVARLCQKLDGIPLAIELAAARSRVLTVEQISERLEDPLGLLTTGDRSSAPRQRTLRATLEWSYGLLGEAERVLFRRLSVFVGGWDLDAAEAVWGGQPAQAGLVLDLLSALVDKSLVVAEAATGGALRYGMLEPVRQFGREKLHESQEESEVRRRHAEHYLALAETAEPELLGPDQGLWLQRLRTEFANLREAHSWSLDPGEEEERARLRLRLPAALWRFWGGRRFEDGKVWLQTALERDPGGFPAVRAKALDGLGFILLFQQDYERAIAALEEAIALYKDYGDRSGEAFALGNLGYALLHGAYNERVPAFVHKAEALMAGDLDGHARAYLHTIRASAALGQGDLDSAMAQLGESLTLSRHLGDRRNTSMALFIRGMIEINLGDLDRGTASLEEGASIARELGDRLGATYFTLGLAKSSALRGRPVRATRLWGAAEVLRERMGMSLSKFDLAGSGYERDLVTVRSELDEAVFGAAWAEGRAMSFERALEYALDEASSSAGGAPADLASSTQPPVKRQGEDDIGGLRNNLPMAQSGFVGREREMSEVGRTLSMTRLLTLTGAGGCGKTRLAVEVARDLVDTSPRSYPDGVWLVELASLSEGELVPGAVAAALGLREQADPPFTDALVDFLRSRKMLLVLDNCEHLIEACARLVDTLLGACEHLRILATSREALGVPGEVNWMVPSLTVPDVRNLADHQIVDRYEAVQLFVERARSRSPGFVLTRENAAAVSDICRKLDGIPLAIELATACMGTLGVAHISERLGDSLGFLTTDDRTRAPRQRTLRAALAWSYDLLSDREQELFGRLSVFAGGWTLQAAERVGSAGDIHAEDVLDLLSRLVQQSLVLAEAETGEDASRYRMLEPVRQYALERLERGGEAQAVRDRHAALFTSLAEQAHTELRGPNQVGWMRRLVQENDNLRAAMAWALSSGDYETAALLGWALWPFWFYRGNHREGRDLMEKVLQSELELPPELRIKATVAVAVMAYGQGDNEWVVEYMTDLLELSRQVGGDSYAEGYARAGLGLVAMNSGDLVTAAARLEEALPLFLECGEFWTAAQTHTWIGTVLLLQGDQEQAVAKFEEGLALARWIEDRASTYNALYALAQVALIRGEHELATRSFREGMGLSEEMGDLANVAYCLEGLATVAGTRDEAERSARLFGAAHGLHETIGVPVWTYYNADRSLYERTVADLREALGEVAFETAFSEGRAMYPERAIEYALDEAVPQPPAAEPARPPAATPAGAQEEVDHQERLRIFALGAGRVESEGLPLDSPDWIQKSRELLYYLLSHPEGRTKEQIGLALWPDASTAQLRSSFHDTVFRLRRALGGKEWVVFEKRRYAFGRSLDYSYDVEVFEENLSEAGRLQDEAPEQAIRHLQAAASLYQGDFLEDFAAGEWALERQDDLRRANGEVLLNLAGLLSAQGRHAEAADAYRKAIAHDRYVEEAHRGLMRSHAALGEPGRALRHYEELAKMLEHQLGSSPAPETVALYERLREGRAAE
jgi:predicted ATPase/DNA-binding SARP family transcriptional activator